MVTIRTLLMPFPSELHLFRFYSNYFFNSVFVIASTPLALAVRQHQLQKSAGKSSNSAIGPAHRMRCTHKTHRICGFFFSSRGVYFNLAAQNTLLFSRIEHTMIRLGFAYNKSTHTGNLTVQTKRQMIAAMRACMRGRPYALCFFVCVRARLKPPKQSHRYDIVCSRN